MLDKIFENKKSTNYLTHNFHTYPAKFPPQIPKYFIENFSKKNDTILDPFVGCGTTLVECMILERNSIGIDLNPIATMVSKCKTLILSKKEVSDIEDFLTFLETKINKSKFYSEFNHLNKLTFFNKDHWFQKNVQIELSFILNEIEKINSKKLETFLKTCFSSIIVKVSNQESDTRYASINKNINDFKTLSSFISKGRDMMSRSKEYSQIAKKNTCKIFTKNSENLNYIDDKSIDLVITSPPYANTYDYYLYHKLRMLWLSFDVKNVQDKEIGSRHKHSSQKKEIKVFLDSIERCFKEVSRVLKNDKYAIIIIGDSIIRGVHYNAKYFTQKIFKKYNMKLVNHDKENLKKTSKMFNPSFTNKNKDEYVLVFKKSK